MKMNKSVNSKVFALVLVILTVAVQLPAPKAHADGDMSFDLGPDGVTLILFVLAAETVLVANGAISSIGNFTYVVRGKKAPAAWRVYGYVFGALNLAVGGLIMVQAKNDFDRGTFDFGACQAGLGAAGLGITIWTNVLDDGSEQSLSVAPFVMPDKEGGVAVGAGIKLAGW